MTEGMILKMKENTPKDVKQAVENLLHTVHRHKDAVIIGFVFSGDDDLPWVVRFGNVQEKVFGETLQGITTLTSKLIAQNMVIVDKIAPVA